MAYQQGTNADGELLSSFYVHKENDNPDFGLDCSDLPSLTRQEFAAECDINTLMERYEKTGVINHFRNGEPQYVDFTGYPDDLQTALNLLADASNAFMQLPAAIRRDFDNDPAKFVEFATDDKNIDKMREWGLAPPLPIEPAPQKVEIINPTPTDKSGA